MTERKIIGDIFWIDAHFLAGPIDEVAARILALKDQFGPDAKIEAEEDFESLAASIKFQRPETDAEMARRLEREAVKAMPSRRDRILAEAMLIVKSRREARTHVG